MIAIIGDCCFSCALVLGILSTMYFYISTITSPTTEKLCTTLFVVIARWSSDLLVILITTFETLYILLTIINRLVKFLEKIKNSC
jgi:ABC-type arginine transport system permease subunit